MAANIDPTLYMMACIVQFFHNPALCEDEMDPAHRSAALSTT